MSQKSKCRKFFQQLQPTFSIDVPRHNATKLEFLDHSDPSRDIVVRKKAREWVNRNKEIQKKRRESQLQMKEESAVKEESRDIVKKEPESVIKTEEFTMLAEPQQIVSMSAVDPFNILPSRTMVGRKYDHIIQFFFHGCPEEIPCSDDKYSDKAKNALIPFSRDNTVLGNMANSDATFILWLYATVTIRDGMKGNVDTEEVQYYYNKSLKVLQDTLKKETDAGVYSDHLLNCMACITATASFAGMFKTAELHRDALVRVLGLRGNGDAVKGLSTAVPWTIKALQWCEIMVATQLVELPKIPYIAQTATTAPPKAVVAEAALATSKSLINLPSLSAAFHNIFHLMHYLGIAYSKLRREEKIDDYIIQPLYDVECALLQVLEAQKQPGHGFTEVEVLLAEALQLYFWTGPRMLPPQTRLCDLLVSRTMRALLPLLLENIPDMHATYTSETAASILDSMSKWNTRAYLHPRTTNNAIAWSLAVGTVVSASLDRPEHCWFKEHLRLQLKFLGLDKDEKEFLKLLDIFPTTEGFSWIKLTNLFGDIAASKI